MTMSRDTALGVQFTLPYFHAADQLIVKSSLKVKSGKELGGATVCLTSGTSTGQLVANYLRGLNIKYTVLAFEATSQAKEAYLAGRCDVFGGYGPVLATMRTRDAKDPNAHTILPDLMAGEPTVLVIKQNDKSLLNALNYVVAILLEAEELGITSANIDTFRGKADASPRVKVLLGETPFIGKQLGWRETWAYDVIKTMGNYGEIFERNFGSQSPYKLERGLNKLWVHGGLHYPIPLL
jgi:general L-amino acid transport system substrate-binding protein